MPTVTLINETQVPLHISLKHISPLHYANSVPPNGGKAELTHVGRVWFTVEARIDRGDNNGYSQTQRFLPIAVVSFSALSLGAGAVYLVGAASAAGGVGTAIATISARAGALAATHAPTARRLYKYALRGQKVVHVGQVLGIGGGALLGRKAAEAQDKALKDGKSKEEAQEAALGKAVEDKDDKASKSKGWFGEKLRVNEAKKELEGLLEGSVVSSPGWYIGGARTIRIKGGPRAAVVDGLLVIETDTLAPFEISADEPEKEDGKVISGDGSEEDARKAKEAAEKDREVEQSRISAAIAGLTSLLPGGGRSKSKTSSESKKEAAEEKKVEEKKRPGVGERLESLVHPAAQPQSPQPTTPGVESSDSEDDELHPAALAVRRDSAPSPMPPPDDDPATPPEPLKVLLAMGFTSSQAAEAFKAIDAPSWLTHGQEMPEEEGEEALSHEEKRLRERVLREGVTESAIEWLFDHHPEAGAKRRGGKAKTAAGTSSEPAKGDSSTSASAPAIPATGEQRASEQPAYKGVVGAEAVTKPHWTQRAQEAAERAGVPKVLKAGGDFVWNRGSKWLGAGGSGGKKK